ncbi:hypothetical protein ACM66B_006016 [Microbotryomycetes sp. NB124-2]
MHPLAQADDHGSVATAARWAALVTTLLALFNDRQDLLYSFLGMLRPITHIALPERHNHQRNLLDAALQEFSNDLEVVIASASDHKALHARLSELFNLDPLKVHKLRNAPRILEVNCATFGMTLQQIFNRTFPGMLYEWNDKPASFIHHEPVTHQMAREVELGLKTVWEIAQQVEDSATNGIAVARLWITLPQMANLGRTSAWVHVWAT